MTPDIHHRLHELDKKIKAANTLLNGDQRCVIRQLETLDEAYRCGIPLQGKFRSPLVDALKQYAGLDDLAENLEARTLADHRLGDSAYLLSERYLGLMAQQAYLRSLLSDKKGGETDAVGTFFVLLSVGAPIREAVQAAARLHFWFTVRVESIFPAAPPGFEREVSLFREAVHACIGLYYHRAAKLGVAHRPDLLWSRAMDYDHLKSLLACGTDHLAIAQTAGRLGMINALIQFPDGIPADPEAEAVFAQFRKKVLPNLKPAT